MRRRAIAFLTGMLVLALFPGPAWGAESSGVEAKFDPGDAGATIEGEWIVALQPFVGPDQAAALAGSAGGRAAQVYEVALRGFLFTGPEVAARRLAEHPRIRKVSANRPVELTAQTEPSGVRRISADDARAVGLTGQGVTVAVIDTGIDLDHPDLQGNIDPSLGKNCTANRSPDDDNGHGSHVAGTVAAIANSTGVVGVAPNVTLVPVKVLDSGGSGSFSDIICGFDYVTANAGSIDVVNMSLGGDDDQGSCNDGFLREAICNSVAAGLTYTVAAGNDNEDAKRHAPANYPEVITVSALDDRTDDFASFSNDGPLVDVIAPGVSILSTGRRGRYVTLSGTSMAAPHAAGVAALALGVEPGLSPAGVRARLLETGECPDGTSAGGDRTCSGQGRWNGDGDSTAEPLVNALRAGGGDEVVDPGPDPDPEPSDGSDPTVNLTSPDSGAAVDGNEKIRAKAADDDDPTSELEVAYRIDDGPWVAMSFVARRDDFKATWDSESVTNGSHTVTVRVTDSSGATATDEATVTVAN
jgi:subtilisin family serine protease